MNNPVIYILLNGELQMSPGKAAAQVAHAAMLLGSNYHGLFVGQYKRTVVVLEAENSDTIRNIFEYLQGANIFAAYYIDEVSDNGKPFQITAMAVEPIEHDDKEKRSIFENFSLFNGQITVKHTDRYGFTQDLVRIKNGTEISEGWLFFRRLKRLVKQNN